MSFSSRAKEDLGRLRLTRDCCARAALAGWIHTAGSLSFGRGVKLRLVTETNAVARWGVQLAKRLYGVETEITVRERKRLGKNRSFGITLQGGRIEALLAETDVIAKTPDGVAILETVGDAIVERDCCARSFLRGAFIGGGSVSDPQKGYHLEFVVRSAALNDTMLRLLNGYDLNAKSVLRKGSHVVYLKEGDRITEFLTLIGAHGAILDLESVRTMKDFRNDLNRKVNCETANLQKTATAAARQIENIRYLIASDAFPSIDAQLQQAAMLRLDHPDVTLAELGEMTTPPVGKSGINHRLRKLDALANALRDETPRIPPNDNRRNDAERGTHGP